MTFAVDMDTSTLENHVMWEPRMPLQFQNLKIKINANDNPFVTQTLAEKICNYNQQFLIKTKLLLPSLQQDYQGSNHHSNHLLVLYDQN